jgi:phenylacetate-CoA ligase
MLQKEGQRLNLKVLLTASEFMSKSLREDLEALYGAEVFDNYGSNELGALGFECPKHTGIHLNSDCYVFEVLRDREPVSPGEQGDIVITGLHNEAMPLIRYEQGDQVLLGEEGKCRCRSYLPRLQAIQGRQADGLVTAEGGRIPAGPVCDWLEKVLGIRDFQLIQKDHQRIILRLTTRFRTGTIEKEVSSYLKGLLGDDLTVEIEEWTHSEMPAKYRPVTSEIARDRIALWVVSRSASYSQACNMQDSSQAPEARGRAVTEQSLRCYVATPPHQGRPSRRSTSRR